MVQVASSLSEAAGAEELANWARIKSSQNSQDFRVHLERFPLGLIAQRARTRLQKLVWSGLGPSPDLGAVRSFLAEFSKGTCIGNAKRRLAWFENDAWANASQANTAVAYNSFIYAWPDSRHAHSARNRVRALEKEASKSEENDAWAVAWKKDDAATYKSFMRDWPTGSHVELARKRLTELETQLDTELLQARIARERVEERRWHVPVIPIALMIGFFVVWYSLVTLWESIWGEVTKPWVH
jgi:hypothetical protein